MSSRADHEKRFAAALHAIATSETLGELRRICESEYGLEYPAALEYVYENARMEAEIALQGYPVPGRGDGDNKPTEAVPPSKPQTHNASDQTPDGGAQP